MATYKVTIDLGNLMLKGISKEYKTGQKRKFKIANRVTSSTDVNPNKRRLQIDGRNLFIGDGDLQNNAIKCDRNHIMDQILVMIGELTGDDESVVIDLGLGLPPRQAFNESYRTKFEKEVTVNTAIECRVAGYYKKIMIRSLHIYHEGYSAYYHVYDENFADHILVIDIGGGTVDACSYVYNIDTKDMDPRQTHTIETGVIALIEELRGYINEDLSSKVPFETIDTAFRGSGIFRYRGENHSVEKYIHLIKPSVESILSNLDAKYNGLDNYQVVIVGGGTKLFTRLGADKISDLYKVDSEKGFYANAEGYMEQLEEDLEELGA